ncbi:MAG: isocitrate dehydrogenase kinase/phosphatase [Planctomycetota bacterium]|jgi:isocitrate dehydrogenase kinase/phosphatase
MVPASTESLAHFGEEAVRSAFERYRSLFMKVTRRARKRFRRREWLDGQYDAKERLGLYKRVVGQVERTLRERLGDRANDRVVWMDMKAMYTRAIADFVDIELAETFFNSVTRRLFDTVGVNPIIEFVDLDMRRANYGPGSPIHRTYLAGPLMENVVEQIFADMDFPVPFKEVKSDAQLVARAILTEWQNVAAESPIERLEIVSALFYRGQNAYIVGRIRGGREMSPLVIAFRHRTGGVAPDAVLLAEKDVSVVFSYTRSYFQVEVARPSDVIRFLNSIMPRKPIAELYMSLGYNKHGKTEMYRDLLGHLGRSMDSFDHTAGVVGMVMIVFTLPSFDYVFKVIRDEFAPPKTSTREDVLRTYQLVFDHDRAGRLVEAQEYDHLTFDAWRFSDALLKELVEEAADTVVLEDDRVHFKHLYIERRVRPLDLFLRENDDERAKEAILDYGYAIRDLARTNIFPGDILLKNFGVTRNGRVIFYDYDEICLVVDCNFRDLPTARNDEEETAAEPWFFVGERDIFPAEFINFLGLNKPQREIFLGTHAEVLTAGFWRELQSRIREGQVLEVYPYTDTRRLKFR